MASKLRSAAATARLLVTMATLLAEESVPPREISRFRFGSVTIRRTGRRSYLTAPFLSDLAEEVAQIGWTMFTINSDQFAIVRTDKASSWLQVSSKRLSLSFEELPREGTTAGAFRNFLAGANECGSITDMDDEDIIHVFDAIADQVEDEEPEE